MMMQSFLPGSAKVLFLDVVHTGTPIDLASFSTKACLRGDDGRLCLRCFMALPNACREQYGVPLFIGKGWSLPFTLY